MEGINLGSGKLFNIVCKYLGGSTAVSFYRPKCSISDYDPKDINVTYTDGSVSLLVGLNENNSENTLKVFPNPSHGIFNLKLDKSYDNISILDMTGKEVYGEIIKNSDLSLMIDSKLAEGMYILRLSSGKKVTYNKLIIQ
jgi:hypothetical protein